MNKKKLLVSLGLVTLVVAAVVGGTTAFFSDTEKSENNTFVAGSVDLKIDSECHYFQDGKDVGCYYDNVPFGTWASTDLTTERFFAFDDVKPGDWGENTLSVTVDDNDAYVCMYIENAVNEENDRIDPEVEAGDVTDDVGELAANLHFTAWKDQGETEGWQGKCPPVTDAALTAVVCDPGEGDNKWQGPDKEPLLFSNLAGPATDVLDGKVYPLDVMMGMQTNYVGVLWCAGELTVDGSEIHCNGRPMGNESQTDSLTADVRFYAEQTRNNPNFECPPIRELTFVRVSPDGGNESNRVTQYNGYYLPHVDYTIDGDCIDFTFINPTPFQFAFDYRVDGEAGTNGLWYDVIIHEGLLNGQAIGEEYNLVTLGGYSSQLVHVCGQDEIQVGLRQGAEQSWYFGWIVFDAVTP